MPQCVLRFMIKGSRPDYFFRSMASAAIARKGEGLPTSTTKCHCMKTTAAKCLLSPHSLRGYVVLLVTTLAVCVLWLATAMGGVQCCTSNLSLRSWPSSRHKTSSNDVLLCRAKS